MLHQYFETEFRRHFVHELTDSQQRAVSKLGRFLTDPDPAVLFVLRGFAGTGKTYLVASLIRLFAQWQQKSVLLAPTGRAAKVLSLYARQPAYTIHKKIYRQQRAGEAFGRFALDRNLHRDTIFIVDEASMIANQSADGNAFGTGRLLDDLIEYVYANQNNCRLIVVGDAAQLPPVGLDLSPALDPTHLRSYYLRLMGEELNEVVRQQTDSGILYNATQIRACIPKQAQEVEFPILNAEAFDDQWRISGGLFIERLEECFDRYGYQNTVVLTRSNQRANRYNQGIRNQILYREEELATGDMLMVVKNNYHWVDKESGLEFVANGDIAQIVRVGNIEEQYGFRFADTVLRFADYDDYELHAKILLDTLASEAPALSPAQQAQLYNAVADSYGLTNKRDRAKALRLDPYYNALQVKFAYAITAHKAQGGQWAAVFIDQGYFLPEMLDREYLRWLYTAVTRATERIYYVNFSDRFFPNEAPLAELDT